MIRMFMELKKKYYLRKNIVLKQAWKFFKKKKIVKI